MTWLFEMEKRRHREGKIAAFLYQNDAVREKSQAALQAINPDPDVQYLTFKPYFNAEAYPFVGRRADDRFTIGHISRQDADKFAADTLRIWEAIESPVQKRGIMLGFGRPSEDKIGVPPDWITTYENQTHALPARLLRPGRCDRPADRHDRELAAHRPGSDGQRIGPHRR